MTSVFDQLSWTMDTDPAALIQLVSTQLDEQETVRSRVREQLVKDYPADALSWLPTVTWSPPTLVPLSSFDLSGITKWPTWDDKKKIALFTEKIASGWHKPIIAVKIPGSRYLLPIDGHTRLSVYWKLHRPVLAWIGKAHSATGPWEHFHRKQRGMTPSQRKLGFASVNDQLAEFANVESAIVITDEHYQLLLAQRRSAREMHEPGHPDRIMAERFVRQARKLRNVNGVEKSEPAPKRTIVEEIATGEMSELMPEHSELLLARREAQKKYPPGHPERVKAERDVRQSRCERRNEKVSAHV
ncbi:MAG TPA: ParB/Srx family N-terminal domain-containing protein [Nitrospira sp.]|nr:ParB/Srx family N-terminal domain-containing protein [Nitrospira sp.]